MCNIFADILTDSTEVDETEVSEARRRRHLDEKFRAMLREVIWQLLMVLLFTWVIVGALDKHIFYQNNDVKHALIDDLEVRLPFLNVEL